MAGATIKQKNTPPVPRLRIVFGDAGFIGPGKIELLIAIAATGSISAAARHMGLSYRRAWLMVDHINNIFAEPVVRSAMGGVKGGGAEVTALGQELISAYNRSERKTRAAVALECAVLQRHLK